MQVPRKRMENMERNLPVSVESLRSGKTMVIMVAIVAIALSILLLGFIGKWKMYKKAGYPGLACLIPFYNSYVWYEMALGSGGMFLLAFMPIVGIFIHISGSFKMASAFGADFSKGFALAICRPVGNIYLGFGRKYQYLGPYNRRRNRY